MYDMLLSVSETAKGEFYIIDVKREGLLQKEINNLPEQQLPLYYKAATGCFADIALFYIPHR